MASTANKHTSSKSIKCNCRVAAVRYHLKYSNFSFNKRIYVHLNNPQHHRFSSAITIFILFYIGIFYFNFHTESIYFCSVSLCSDSVVVLTLTGHRAIVQIQYNSICNNNYTYPSIYIYISVRVLALLCIRKPIFGVIPYTKPTKVHK